MQSLSSTVKKPLPTEVKIITDLVTELVDPKQRQNVNANPDHLTVLHGTKSKKQFSRKTSSRKSKTLTRKEYTDLGLYTLPKNMIKYSEMLQLHNLWKGYMRELLMIFGANEVPSISDPTYDAFNKLLTKADFHGAKITVRKSKCSGYNGLSGIIVLDTKNTIKIVGHDDKLRTVPKMDSIFTISCENIELTIVGKHWTVKPAERSVKKLKGCMELDL